MSARVIEFKETYKGFTILGVFYMTHRCGYVIIPEDHPLHGRDYNDIDVDVHGGLTFSGTLDTDYAIGFDCAHAHDAQDFVSARKHNTLASSMIDFLEAMSKKYPTGGTIRDEAYVKAECMSLVDQIITKHPKWFS